MTSLNALATRAPADVADGRRIDTQADRQIAVPLRATPDFPDRGIAELELRDLCSVRSASVPLPVVRVLLRGSKPDVRRVHAGRVSAEVPRVSAWRNGAPRKEEYRSAQVHLPSADSHRSVPSVPRVERVGDAQISRCLLKLRHCGSQPSENGSPLNTSCAGVPVFAKPVVVRLTKVPRVVGSAALRESTQSVHTSSIRSCKACCHIAALVTLGVPT
jgi:hypothetical protein